MRNFYHGGTLMNTDLEEDGTDLNHEILGKREKGRWETSNSKIQLSNFREHLIFKLQGRRGAEHREVVGEIANQ
jgi:hypothetical protein